jgi:hypothetical protein
MEYALNDARVLKFVYPRLSAATCADLNIANNLFSVRFIIFVVMNVNHFKLITGNRTTITSHTFNIRCACAQSKWAYKYR